MDEILLSSLERLLTSRCSPSELRVFESGAPSDVLWHMLAEQGYPQALLPEEAGGIGLGLDGLRRVLLLLGEYPLPFPLAETMIAHWLLSANGVDAPQGCMVLIDATAREGALHSAPVPFALVAQHALLSFQGRTVLVPLAGAELAPTGLRGSFSAHVSWPNAPQSLATLTQPRTPLIALNGALRAGLMTGAMRKILAITLDYANSREQFGRSIGKFQVIQQQLAEMAELVLSADMAMQIAFAGPQRLPGPWPAALAKQRTSAAVSRVAAIAHAVHGAIGLSEEYQLQLYVRRLYEWRLADGGESYWSCKIGEQFLNTTGDALEFIRSNFVCVD